MEAVIVPATSANLGCAFDCAAVALNLYLRVRSAPRTQPGIEIVYRGSNPESVPTDNSNLIARGINSLAAWANATPPNLRLEIENEIPVGIGLGSSAAAIVAGIVLGARICEIEPEPAVVLRLAAEIEGHPDNVAAAYYGGLVVSARCDDSRDVLAIKADVPRDLEFIVIVPEIEMPTKQSRAILPVSYSRADAVHNLQRTALFVASAFSGRFDFQPEFFRDRLHQPHRCSLIPGLEDCLKIEHPDLLGGFLSGAGSSVLAVVRENAPKVAELFLAAFARQGLPAKAQFLRADNQGARHTIGQETLEA